MASVVSGPLSAAVLQLDGAGGLAGWQWLFILEGLPACLLGLYTLYFLPDRPSAVSWLSAEEQAATAAALAAEYDPGAITQLSSALRDRRVVTLTISYFFLIVGVLGVTLWLPLLLFGRRGLRSIRFFRLIAPYSVRNRAGANRYECLPPPLFLNSSVLPRWRRRSGRHRVHQRRRQPWGLRRPLHGRMAQGLDRLF